MGMAVNWCAVRNEDTQRLLEHLGLAPTDTVEAWPEAAIALGHFIGGWTVLWCNVDASRLLREKAVRALAGDCDVLVCRIEEHVMAASAEYWSQGRRLWWIAHNGEEGPIGLETQGELPADALSIRGQLQQRQDDEGGIDADTDYLFEIPLEIAASMTGFKHDDDRATPVDGWRVVEAVPAYGGFWSRLTRR